MMAKPTCGRRTYVYIMQYKGEVKKELVAKGSKSEHRAVLLDTGKKQYILRRLGGNAFSDPALDRLVGKTISATGNVTGNTLIMSEWSEKED
jgi:hypothetical protein